MTASDIHSLSGAYALDAVDDLERVAFERHLRECDPCALEVRELRETVTRLADPAAVDPPPSLRSSVLDAVARTPQARPGRPDRSQSSGHASAARWRRFAAVAVAASVLAAGVGVGTWTVAHRDATDARHAAADAQARTDAIGAVLAASDVQVIKMPGRDGGTVNLAVARSQNKAVAVLTGLPALQDDQVYQLWMIPPGGAAEAVSRGVLSVGQTADTRVIEVGDGVQFGVSIEPKGGSKRPTLTQIIAAGEFST